MLSTLNLFSLTAFADLNDLSTASKADIIRTTYGDFNAYGLPIVKQANMDFQTVTKLAEQGNHNAQFHLAKMYELGVHTDQDKDKAMQWYRMAADNGNASAMNNLAVHLAEHSSADFTSEGVALLQKASEQNQPHAMTNLAVFQMESYLYDQTKQIDKQTYDDSIALLVKVGETGFAPAYYHLSEYYGKDVMKSHKDMDEKSRDDIDAQRFNYLTKSAEMGFAPAQMALSDYHQMHGVMSPAHDVRPMGIAMSYRWAKRACTNGIERGCDTAKLFGQYKSNDSDLVIYKKNCDEGDEQSCQAYAILKNTQELLQKIDSGD